MKSRTNGPRVRTFEINQVLTTRSEVGLGQRSCGPSTSSHQNRRHERSRNQGRPTECQAAKFGSHLSSFLIPKLELPASLLLQFL